ncbi:hypothetical protein [Rhizobium yanglingense]
MTARDTEIVVEFQPVPFAQFRETDVTRRLPAEQAGHTSAAGRRHEPGDIVIKSPGLSVDTVPVSLDFRYADQFDIAKMTGYESLLYDLLIGDQTLFQRADGIKPAGRRCSLSSTYGRRAASQTPTPPAAWGLARADGLIERDGRRWHALDVLHAKHK